VSTYHLPRDYDRPIIHGGEGVFEKVQKRDESNRSEGPYQIKRNSGKGRRFDLLI